MLEVSLKGVFPPIPTPFSGRSVAYDHLAANVIKWCRTGIAGFVVLGSNGEYPLLDTKEKLKTVETVAGHSRAGMPIIAGTGCESTAETIALTRACAQRGATAALVVTPHYYGGHMTAAALTTHYTQVADNAPIPVILYNVPKFTHINLAPETVGRLAAHPNIIGIKDSSGNVAQLGEYLNQSAGAEFTVLVGTAGALLGAATLGCPGAVLALANLAADACVAIMQQVEAGDIAAAAEVQRRMIPVNKAVTATYGIAGLKAALEVLGYHGGAPRPPLMPVNEKERDQIEQILKTAQLL